MTTTELPEASEESQVKPSKQEETTGSIAAGANANAAAEAAARSKSKDPPANGVVAVKESWVKDTRYHEVKRCLSGLLRIVILAMLAIAIGGLLFQLRTSVNKGCDPLARCNMQPVCCSSFTGTVALAVVAIPSSAATNMTASIGVNSGSTNGSLSCTTIAVKFVDASGSPVRLIMAPATCGISVFLPFLAALAVCFAALGMFLWAFIAVWRED